MRQMNTYRGAGAQGFALELGPYGADLPGGASVPQRRTYPVKEPSDAGKELVPLLAGGRSRAGSR